VGSSTGLRPAYATVALRQSAPGIPARTLCTISLKTCAGTAMPASGQATMVLMPIRRSWASTSGSSENPGYERASGVFAQPADTLFSRDRLPVTPVNAGRKEHWLTTFARHNVHRPIAALTHAEDDRGPVWRPMRIIAVLGVGRRRHTTGVRAVRIHCPHLAESPLET